MGPKRTFMAPAVAKLRTVPHQLRQPQPIIIIEAGYRQRNIRTSIEYQERSTEQVTLEETKVSVQTGNYSVEFGQRREAFSTWSQSPGPRPGPRHILTDYGCTGRRCVFTTSVATARPRTLPPSWSERQWIPP